MTLDVSVHDAQVVHVLKHCGSIPSNSNPLFGGEFNCLLLHMEHVVEGALRHMLKHDVDVGDLRDHTHQDRDVRMSQYTLHDDFVLDFLQQLVCEARVENLLDGHRGTVQLPLVDDAEATLGNLFAQLDISNGDLSNTWHWWQTPRAHRNVGGLSES